MCLNPTRSAVLAQPLLVGACPAKALGAEQRQDLAVHVRAGCQSITHLAEQFQVSRKFVYQQAATATEALEQAFAPPGPTDDSGRFDLPVSKSWLRQVMLSLVLDCHSSYRGVIEFCRDVLAYPLAVGTVHNVLAPR